MTTPNNKFTNFAATTLASGISAGATSISLAAGTGALFPSLGAGEYFYAVMLDAATGTTKEVVKVTARSTDTLTVTRAQDNTSASAFIAGDKFELRLVAATMQNFAVLETSAVQALNAQMVGGLTTSQLALLTTSPVQALNVTLHGGLTTSQIALLVTSPVQALNVSLHGSLTTSQIGVLSTTGIWSAPQKGTVTTDNDLSFDLSARLFFTCTPSAGGALTFTNIPSDGCWVTIKLVNGSNYAITAAANTKVTSSFLTTISATGTYIITGYCDGTNVHCSTPGASA